MAWVNIAEDDRLDRVDGEALWLEFLVNLAATIFSALTVRFPLVLVD